jgi:hypothetical protein
VRDHSRATGPIERHPHTDARPLLRTFSVGTARDDATVATVYDRYISPVTTSSTLRSSSGSRPN